MTTKYDLISLYTAEEDRHVEGKEALLKRIAEYEQASDLSDNENMYLEAMKYVILQQKDHAGRIYN